MMGWGSNSHPDDDGWGSNSHPDDDDDDDGVG